MAPVERPANEGLPDLKPYLRNAPDLSSRLAALRPLAALDRDYGPNRRVLDRFHARLGDRLVATGHLPPKQLTECLERAIAEQLRFFPEEAVRTRTKAAVAFCVRTNTYLDRYVSALFEPMPKALANAVEPVSSGSVLKLVDGAAERFRRGLDL